MAYHNKVYVSMDADNDLRYYRLSVKSRALID